MSVTSFAQNVNSLGNIDDIDGRLPNDDVIFAEVREVLRRHGVERKYGLTLLHKHFDIEEDEVMVEFTDIVGRTQISKPVKVQEISTKSLIEVTWRLDDERLMSACDRYCSPTTDIHGNPRHSANHTKRD